MEPALRQPKGRFPRARTRQPLGRAPTAESPSAQDLRQIGTDRVGAT
jgi:hypothetical protein